MNQQSSSSNKTFKYILLGVIACTLYYQVSEKWTNDHHKNIIFSDAQGYYAYLPAVFIYHDMNFGFKEAYENKYYEEGKRANFCNEFEGKRTDKYFCGVAVLMLPFFLLACLCSKIFGFPVDGYSYFFQVSVGVAALFYLVIGLIFLRKLLLYYCKDTTAIFLALAFFFGTNMLFYGWVEPGMSHIYSFAVMAVFLYYLKLSINTHSKKNILRAAFFYGLVILIRPPNAVIILALPFLAGTWENTKHFFVELFQSPGKYIPAGLICLGIVFIQMLVFYIECGHWIVYSYTGEKFDFSHPEILNVLFSYRKGLFIYTPLTFLALGGMIVLIKRNKFEYFSILLLLVVTTWVISSWWSWWYGGSYGHRAFIEYFSIFAVLLAIFYDSIRSILRKLILTILILMIVSLNLFQTWQYHHNIMPYDGMTKELYWTLFLKSNERYVGIYYEGHTTPKEMNTDHAIIFKNDLESPDGLFNTNTLTNEKAHSGKMSSKIGGDVNKSVTFSKKAGEIGSPLDSIAFVQVKIWAWLGSLEADAQIVISFENGGTSAYDWHANYIAHQILEEEKWGQAVMNVTFPSNVKATDDLNIYVLEGNKRIVYIDDTEIAFIKKR